MSGPKIRIVSDGEPLNTQVLVDGEPLAGVSKVGWTATAGEEYCTAEITVANVEVDVVGVESAPPVPHLGQIVLYKLSGGDAWTINSRRGDTRPNEGSEWGPHKPGQSVAEGHFGLPASFLRAGELYPMIITRVWGDKVNGQVFIDGGAMLWVTSVDQGEGERQWRVV